MKTIQVKGFEAYRIREDGILETNWRTGAHYPGMPCEDKWKPLSQRHNDSGYIPVNLRDGKGNSRRTHIHRLVAEAFLGDPPFENACVRHLDGNARNNSIENLAWGTYQDNENDKLAHGTHRSRITNAKLDAAKMKLITNMAEQGISHAKIARLIGVSRPTITRFLSGSTWQ